MYVLTLHVVVVVVIVIVVVGVVVVYSDGHNALTAHVSLAQGAWVCACEHAKSKYIHNCKHEYIHTCTHACMQQQQQ
jgi:hypothetical protein